MAENQQSHRDLINQLLEGDSRFEAAESASIASLSLWYVWRSQEGASADATLQQAFEMAYPNVAAEHSLAEHFEAVQEAGPASVTGFVSGLKSKQAEIQAQEQLEQAGWSDVQIAADPTQPVWDISATNPSGEEVLFQVKTGGEGYGNAVGSAMENNPDVHFMVSSEIHDKVASSSPELLDQMTDIGPDYALTAGMHEDLETLSYGLGIEDMGSSVSDLIPLAGTIVLGWKLIKTVQDTNQDFADSDRTTKKKIAVVQTLTVFSRYGIRTVLATVCGAAGAFGGLFGIAAGALGGVWIGGRIHRKIKPRLLEIALKITGLTVDDIFYYRNKARFDELEARFAKARRLALTA